MNFTHFQYDLMAYAIFILLGFRYSEADKKDRLLHYVSRSCPFELLESCDALFMHFHTCFSSTYIMERASRESIDPHVTQCSSLSFSPLSSISEANENNRLPRCIPRISFYPPPESSDTRMHQ